MMTSRVSAQRAVLLLLRPAGANGRCRAGACVGAGAAGARQLRRDLSVGCATFAAPHSRNTNSCHSHRGSYACGRRATAPSAPSTLYHHHGQQGAAAARLTLEGASLAATTRAAHSLTVLPPRAALADPQYSSGVRRASGRSNSVSSPRTANNAHNSADSADSAHDSPATSTNNRNDEAAAPQRQHGSKSRLRFVQWLTDESVNTDGYGRHRLAMLRRLNTVRASAKYRFEREQERLKRLRARQQHQFERLKERATTTLISDSLPRTEKIATVPNMLSLYRILITPVIVANLVDGHPNMACGLFATAAISDWLDGAIARKFPSQRSILGTVVDPFADKFLIVASAASLGYIGAMPAWLAGLVLLKDATMMLASFYIRYSSLKAVQTTPVTASDYFNLKRPTVRVIPSFIAKVNTAVQLSLFAFLIAQQAFPTALALDPQHATIIWGVTGFTTFAAGLTYVRSTTALQYLHKYKAS
ncbi:histidine-rich glycoprotein [Salpingoeca rosetta]|uniref:Histidine-rich glycoprotein n=1 Tax=Salpingoeca rosetta (strain ATCC 50818 / BSB-021) TaxID=946362 RepID=F2UK76_SALR5|nr:histidine-rich glycoprotein [Salpingoeca rosetta]EGD77525.1 histidine-rich glycoprotein [Salpingoeca rosetta]|eukprot:XP_004990413.1 histidine-rich glycoprotein [Salpingoeca rosetta]